MNADADAVIRSTPTCRTTWAIEPMVDAYRGGCGSSTACAGARSDTWFKRWSAEAYYRLRAPGRRLVPNHADYRLLSRRALKALGDYGEVNLFLRGIIPQLGFPPRSSTTTGRTLRGRIEVPAE